MADTASSALARGIASRRGALDAVASMGMRGLAIPDGMSINVVIDRLCMMPERMIVRGLESTRRELAGAPERSDLKRGLRVLEGECAERGLVLPA